MGKVPYMPFYPERYLADDRLAHFTLEQHGAYLLLLMHMWNRGGQLLDDDRYLAGLVHASPKKWQALRQVIIGPSSSLTINKHDTQFQPIISFVDPDSGIRFITQKKLRDEYEKTIALIEKKREGGRIGGRSPKGQLKDSLSTVQGQLKDTLSTPKAQLKDTSSNKELDLDKDQDEDQELLDPGLSTISEEIPPGSIQTQTRLHQKTISPGSRADAPNGAWPVDNPVDNAVPTIAETVNAVEGRALAPSDPLATQGSKTGGTVDDPGDTRPTVEGPPSPDGASDPLATQGSKTAGFVYPAAFEDTWAIYPHKIEKRRAFRAWQTALRQGVDPTLLRQATSHYAEECARRRTETRYIKHAATFWGRDRPWEDYVSGVPPDHRDDGEIDLVPDSWHVLRQGLRDHAGKGDIHDD